MTSNVPEPTFDTKGAVIPLESDVLLGVMADLKQAFGGDLTTVNADGSLNLSTPQGQLASTETAIIGDKNNQFLWYINNVDPAFASGRMQDAIGRIYFINRKPALSTVVQATCRGGSGVRIPTGAKARATDGTIYFCTSGGTIPLSGLIVLPFAASVTGAIPCAIHSLNEIYQFVPGWDSVDNLSDGSLGNEVESRIAFEQRRSASVAKNSTGSLAAVYSSVLEVAGVLDAFAYENTTSAPITYGGYTLAPHSLYVAVVGGNSAQVARAIWTKKAPGCDYNGNTAVVVYDTTYDQPQPSYLVKYQTPTPVPILFAITLASNASVPSDALQQIQNALIQAFAGSDGGSRARIGGRILASRFYAPITRLGNWVEIISLELGITAPTLFQVTLNIDQNPTISASNISLLVV